jgi:hypothetical protein
MPSQCNLAFQALRTFRDQAFHTNGQQNFRESGLILPCYKARLYPERPIFAKNTFRLKS